MSSGNRPDMKDTKCDCLDENFLAKNLFEIKQASHYTIVFTFFLAIFAPLVSFAFTKVEWLFLCANTNTSITFKSVFKHRQLSYGSLYIINNHIRYYKIVFTYIAIFALVASLAVTSVEWWLLCANTFSTDATIHISTYI